MKSSTTTAIYVVDPDGYLYWIPSPTVYANLWDSWNGIATASDSLLADCFDPRSLHPDGSLLLPLTDAHLVKSGSDPKVYVWDANATGVGNPGYRWITSAEVFNKYGFSWQKIRTESSISPVATNWPWD